MKKLNTGKLDQLWDQAKKEIAAGKARPLDELLDVTEYRFSDEATSDTRKAATVEDAARQYLAHYDTAEMGDGETFEARVFDGTPGQLIAVITVTADGKSGVKSWTIKEI